MSSLSSTKQRLVVRSGSKFTSPVVCYEQLKSLGRTTSQQRYISKVQLDLCTFFVSCNFWQITDLIFLESDTVVQISLLACLCNGGIAELQGPVFDTWPFLRRLKEALILFY